MTRRRFYAAPERFSADGTSVRLGVEETRHLRNVLRLKAGDQIYLFDGLGREFSGEVQTIARDSTEVNLIKEVDAAQPESGLNLTLAVALLKGEKFDLVIQKTTELGVARVIPLITARADVRIRSADDAARKTTRWQRIALEATKQCGRARLMTIEAPVTFADQVKAGGEASLMFAERDGISFAETLGAGLLTTGVTALVGPEGGWTDEEIAQARDSGWKIVTLGGRILRAETAAIVVATLIQHRFGDLS